MYKDELISYLQQFIETQRKPNPTQLIYILADYLTKNPPTEVHCSKIALDIQLKYGFWSGANDPERAAVDAVSKALVYGIATPERYPKDNERRALLENLLSARIVVSPLNNRTISLKHI
ncbi:hypothetical protein [Vibrio aestuarianus]|uniref:Uncharacterized protein n=1 Tax=Vibrio aestuarianus TaxID=28171 RepID=A0ABD7YQV0_9VIBR|nr:hypothetical protein [Vibrio aestuarianus]MDE1266233.1 hypothetical protein [Vibrio aestuarianus]MDE1298379.1 hypothetical protein [Vibrio aestuarianus]WGK87470.1 hypothetical protein PYE67_15260 [Vibrio aestuarianus]CAH8199427.1 hypothetical protein VAEU17_2780001 [Vibrio aestuarianus]